MLWLGSEPIAGAAEGVQRLRDAGEEVVFATNNASARVADQEAKLEAMGIPARGFVVTSAQAGAALIDPGERALVVGGPGLREEVDKRGATIVSETPCDVVISGLDRELTYAHLRNASVAIGSGARWILTNSDVTYPTLSGPEPGAGAIGAAIAAASGVEPIVAGKPHAPMADLIRRRLGEDGVVVGDRADTDGLFALALGYRFCLALSGITTAADLPVHPEPWHVGTDLRAIVSDVLG